MSKWVKSFKNISSSEEEEEVKSNHTSLVSSDVKVIWLGIIKTGITLDTNATFAWIRSFKKDSKRLAR